MKFVLFVYFVLYLSFICPLLFNYNVWKNADIKSNQIKCVSFLQYL